MKYSVDRIEGSTAVLIDESKNTTTVSTTLLPDKIKPGDMLIKSGGRYIFDEEETDRRKKHLYDLQNRLFTDKNSK